MPVQCSRRHALCDYRELDVDDFHQDSGLRNFDHVPTGGALAFGVLRWDGQARCMDVPFYLSCSSAAGAGLHSNVTLKTGVFVCAAMASFNPRLQVVLGSEYLPEKTRLCHTRKLSDEAAKSRPRGLRQLAQNVRKRADLMYWLNMQYVHRFSQYRHCVQNGKGIHIDKSTVQRDKRVNGHALTCTYNELL